jgi:hypothetical protein
MRKISVRWAFVFPFVLSAGFACAQERHYLEDDPAELAAKYLSHIQQVAGMQRRAMPSAQSRTQAVQIARNTAIQGADAQFGHSESAQKTRLIEDVTIKLTEQYDEVVAGMPTRYSDWFTLWLVGDLAQDIDLATDKLGYKAVMPPVRIGDVPTVCVNALAVRVPESPQRLVLVQSGMVNSTWHAMNLFVASIGADGRGTLDVNFDTVRDKISRKFIAPYFANALGAAAGRIPNPVLLTTSYQRELVGDLHRGAILFILAHEYAHVILRHTESNARSLSLRMAAQPGAAASTAIDVVTSAKSRKQELEADRLGFELLVSSSRIVHYTASRVDTIALAAEVYFAWLEIFDASVSQFTGDASPDYNWADHPSPTERLKALSIYRSKMGLKTPNLDGFREAWRQRLSAMNNATFKRIYGDFLNEYKLAECN